jgi:Flp pilus assembly protein TadD
VTRPSRRAIALALFVFAGLAFLPTLANGFVKYDDDDYVVQNPMVQHGLTLDSVRWAFTSFHAGNWHPITWLSHIVDWQLFGERAWGHHLVGLLLHLATCLLVFLWLDETTGARWRSAAVAALFAVHPLRVESVAWASERKDLLCAFFFVAACWAHCRSVRARGRSSVWVVVLGALALGAKPMAVTLPFVLLLLDLWPLARTRGERPARWPALVLEKVPLVLLAAGSALLTVKAQKAWGSVTSMQALPFGERLGNAIVNYVHYLAVTLWPVGLVPLYPLPSLGPALAPLIGAAALLLGLTAFVLWRARREPAVLVGWCWFLGVLFPVSGIAQAGLQSIADRYSYLPHLGLFIACAWAVPALGVAGRRALAVALVALLAISAGMSFWLTRFWHDPETLFGRVHRLSPDNPMGNVALAVERMRTGRLAEAEPLLRSAVQEMPGLVTALGNLGNLLVAEGRTAEGVGYLAQAHARLPQDLDVAWAYARALAKAGRLDEAIAAGEEIARQEPDRPGLALQLGTWLGRRGHPAEALALLAHAVELAPDDPAAHEALGVALAQSGRFREAIPELERVLQLAPNFPGARQMLQFAREDAAKQ